MVRKGKCPCGIVVKQVKRWPQHVASKWHRGYRQAVELRKRGMPLSEIARIVGVTESYVSQRLKKLR